MITLASDCQLYVQIARSMKASLPALVCLLLLQQCSSRSKVASGDPEPLTLLSASAQVWTSGVKGGASGTEYIVTVVVNTDQRVSVEEMVLADSSYTPVLTKPGAPVGRSVVPAKDDTLNIRVSVPGPDVYRADHALIRCTVADRLHTLVVPKISQLPPHNRP